LRHGVVAFDGPPEAFDDIAAQRLYGPAPRDPEPPSTEAGLLAPSTLGSKHA
jgi:hypothetical protein